jgi:hypothetical protein
MDRVLGRSLGKCLSLTTRLPTSFQRRGCASDLKRNLVELEENGFTVVNNVFTNDELDAMQSDYIKLNEKAEKIRNETEAKIRYMEENDTAIESKYWKPDISNNINGDDEEILILQAGVGRYDLYKGFGGIKDGIYGKDIIKYNPIITNIINKLLISDYTSYTGIIDNTIGSTDQYWHRDTDTLSNTNTNGAEMIQIDDFYFTCLIPCTVSRVM